MSRPARSPRRSPRESRRRRECVDEPSLSKDNDDVSSSPAIVSPSSWNVNRGRSRARRLSNAFSEENLRIRCVVVASTLKQYAHIILWPGPQRLSHYCLVFQQSLLFGTTVEVGSRIRVRGLWGGHVYLRCPVLCDKADYRGVF